MENSPNPYIITVVGPESSGKTTLTRQLAQTLGCSWVEEVARYYIDKLQRPYEESDLIKIAQRQLKAMDEIQDQERQLYSGNELKSALEQILSQPTNFRPKESVLMFPMAEFGSQQRKIILVDNGLLNIKLWAKIKYGSTVPIVEDALKEDETDLYMLCRPILPWEPDPQREAPSLLDRSWIYNQFLEELVKQKRISTGGLL